MFDGKGGKSHASTFVMAQGKKVGNIARAHAKPAGVGKKATAHAPAPVVKRASPNIGLKKSEPAETRKYAPAALTSATAGGKPRTRRP